jgi:hypothetical protein
MSIIKRSSAFLTQRSTVLVVQASVLSNLDYCAVIWSDAAKPQQLAQNQAARLALNQWCVFMDTKGSQASPIYSLRKIIIVVFRHSVFHNCPSIQKRLNISHWRKHQSERNSAPLSLYV